MARRSAADMRVEQIRQHWMGAVGSRFEPTKDETGRILTAVSEKKKQ
jgi:hypothetical protein